MSPSPVSRHLVGAVLLQILSGALSITRVFVGETFDFACAQREGYWRLNGNLTGQVGATYYGTATENLDGFYNCTNEEGTITYSSAKLIVYGLLGVSPSSKCSSTDNTTNTCTVSAAAGSSLTLCADFTRYPKGASRYAELTKIMWKQVLPSEETFRECYDSNCTGSSSPAGYSFREDWSRCLHVDSVEGNSVFNYSIEEVNPPRTYPSGIVHTKVLFSVQVGPSPTPSPTSTTTEEPATSISVSSSSAAVSSEVTSSVAVVTPSTVSVRVPPPPPVGVGMIVGVVIGAIVILMAVAVLIAVAVVIFKKRRLVYYLRKSSDGIIDPESQQNANEGRRRPSDLQIGRQNSAMSPSTYPSITTPSSQRPLLHPEQDGPPGSLGPPSYNTAMNHTNGHALLPHPQPPVVVPNGTAPYVYYFAHGNHQPQDNSASNRDSLCQDLPGIEFSPEAFT